MIELLNKSQQSTGRFCTCHLDQLPRKHFAPSAITGEFAELLFLRGATTNLYPEQFTWPGNVHMNRKLSWFQFEVSAICSDSDHMPNKFRTKLEGNCIGATLEPQRSHIAEKC